MPFAFHVRLWPSLARVIDAMSIMMLMTSSPQSAVPPTKPLCEDQLATWIMRTVTQARAHSTLS